MYIFRMKIMWDESFIKISQKKNVKNVNYLSELIMRQLC